MPIVVQCQCGKQLRARDELAGKRVKCPGCGRELAIVAPSAAKGAARAAGASSKEPAAAASQAAAASARPQAASAAHASNVLGGMHTCGFCRATVPADADVCPECGFSLQAPTTGGLHKGAAKAMAVGGLMGTLLQTLAAAFNVMFRSAVGLVITGALILGGLAVGYYAMVVAGAAGDIDRQVRELKKQSEPTIVALGSKAMHELTNAGAEIFGGGRFEGKGPFPRAPVDRVDFPALTLSTDMPESIPVVLHLYTAETLKGELLTQKQQVRFTGYLRSRAGTYDLNGTIDLKAKTADVAADLLGVHIDVYIGYSDGRKPYAYKSNSGAQDGKAPPSTGDPPAPAPPDPRKLDLIEGSK